MAGDPGQIQDGSREALVHVQAKGNAFRTLAGQVLDMEENRVADAGGKVSWTKTVPSWMSAALHGRSSR